MSVISRAGFRFAFLYFSLYCLLSQIVLALIPIPVDLPGDLGSLPPIRLMVFWVAKHIFRYEHPLVFNGSGSGDKVYDWVLTFCLLAIAAVGTCVWSAVVRAHPNDHRLHTWFRVFIRFALAGQLILYGLIKIVPMQMPYPSLVKLLEPYGNFSSMGVLWQSIGASPAYERFAGSAELMAGLLLIVPATTTLGALICLMDMIDVFALNMTYDVPVKLLSFHLIVMAAILLLPERSRLVNFFLRDRPAEASAVQPLFATRRANRIATAAQIAFGSLLLASNIYSIRRDWFKWGGGAPKSALYGIWNVEQMSVDGVVRSPLLTDFGRWRRVIFDYPEQIVFQRMNDSFANFGTTLDTTKWRLTLTDRRDKKWKGQLAVRRQGTGLMTLEGQMGPHAVHMQLSLMDRNKFLLVSRGFHWVQDYPLNR